MTSIYNPSWKNPRMQVWCKLVILAQIYDELSCGETKFPRILSQNVQNVLEGQGQWPIFSIPTESISWCMFGANLVILAQICEIVIYSIMMFMKLSDISQSDRSIWVMWQVKDPCPRPEWDGCLTRKKNYFHKKRKTWIILLYNEYIFKIQVKK